MSKETQEDVWGMNSRDEGSFDRFQFPNEDPELHDDSAPVNDAEQAAEATDQEQSANLTEQDKAILDFESKLWKKTAVKERAIAQTLGISPMVYYQRLITLSRSPAAAVYAPVVVRRLKQVYEQRTSLRLR